MLPQANLGKKQYVSNCDSCYRTNSHHPTDHDRTLLRLQLHWLCGLRSSQNHRTLLQFFCFAFGNKATGWLAALVKATNLKLCFLRLRDKMLIFVGLVKACLQYGYSFRLACVWLKRKNLRFGCAVKRFCSSIKKHEKFHEVYDFQSSQSSQENIQPSSFFSSRSFSARVLLATQRPQTATRRHYNACPAVSPSVPFSYTFWFSCGAWTFVSILTTATCSVT